MDMLIPSFAGMKERRFKIRESDKNDNRAE